MNTEDSSIEFDLYEDARQHLTEFLEKEGHKQLEAERIAFYIIQGVRGIPKLLSLLNQPKTCPPLQIHAALKGVFDNLGLLNKASMMLTENLDDKP